MVGGETLQGKKVDGVGEFSKVRASEKKTRPQFLTINSSLFRKQETIFQKNKEDKKEVLVLGLQQPYTSVFTGLISFNPHCNPKKYGLPFLFYNQGK